MDIGGNQSFCLRERTNVFVRLRERESGSKRVGKSDAVISRKCKYKCKSLREVERRREKKVETARVREGDSQRKGLTEIGKTAERKRDKNQKKHRIREIERYRQGKTDKDEKKQE